MYKGKKTLFYNGETLYDDENGEFLVYDEQERFSWQVIIILPGVEVIPDSTFCSCCCNVETVIMSDTVRRVEDGAFSQCWSLEYVRLSRNLEYIGESAFFECRSLTSIFIPPSCREIGKWAFNDCEMLIILSVPRHTQLGQDVIGGTSLIKASPFETNDYGEYEDSNGVNEWIKCHHDDNQFSLHRACASYNPLDEVIFNIIKSQGLKAFKKQDSVGVTVLQYLSENPYTEIKEQNIIKRYILDMIGEII
ncbi:hypothetical protein CTEN210_01149 [Chaetoceros tenuissimus]|uniref:Leucine-rich repeat domain-containing protein n=1 Tax=Chaetoceros tenuissimus TaxID=426638 RepID=A0AAD3GZE0_9STRA|nr:hypothetical protein CTEN210_01149 [Chaetoceros tenuissimus]